VNTGVVYNLSLTLPFNQTTNLYSLFGLMPKPNSNDNITANFIDGAMFVNNNDFILYGYSDTESFYRLMMLTDVRGEISRQVFPRSPAANLILGYDQDQDNFIHLGCFCPGVSREPHYRQHML